jgi:hypothetical protein
MKKLLMLSILTLTSGIAMGTPSSQCKSKSVRTVSKEYTNGGKVISQAQCVKNIIAGCNPTGTRCAL